jgi:hypothetical protein
VANCKYDIPTQSSDGTEKVDPSLVSPILYFNDGTAQLIGRDASGSCPGEGYKLNSATELELCSATCKRLQSDPLARLEFIFGCGEDIPPDVLQ